LNLWFSIVVPVLNEEEHIPSLLQSIFKQTYRPIEVVMVDGGSTDRTTELIKQFADKFGNQHFIVSLINEVEAGSGPRGLPFARNLGIERARGAYILLLDADIVPSETDIVGQLVLTLKDNHTARFRSNTRTDTWLEYNVMLDNKARLFRRAGEGRVCGLAFRRWVLQKFRFDPSLGLGEDKDMLLRIAKAGLPDPTIISATGVMHSPHTFAELRNQRQWYGRTALLWLKKHHSVRDLFELSPALPFVLLVGQFIGYLSDIVLGVLLTGTFLIIPILFFLKSPTKDASRLTYLVLIRFIYGSFFFSLGITQAMVQLARYGRIDRSRR
jgi:cellulose synthase/poly-beta-1,6-N-acetylglucosamine synthase-like glycosyltransferase